MNSEENRRKGAEYVTSVMDAQGQGKTVIYMDETNVNLFLKRACGKGGAFQKKLVGQNGSLAGCSAGQPRNSNSGIAVFVS